MDLGTVLSVAQTLFAALQCAELKEFCNILGYKSELEKLERTVKIVKAVLEEAESNDELPPQSQLYVDQLKDVVFDADDLLDEFVTLAKRKKQLIKEGKASEKLRHLFSRFNPLATAYKMSQGVKEIRKRLDEIANEHVKFGFKLDNKPILRRREETCSYVDVKGIIGRDDDVEEIVGRLLVVDSVDRDVSGVAIVGLGGLGKTALAQVVFNDARVVESFDLRVWTCVSDQDQKTLNVKRVLCGIFHSLSEGKSKKLALEPLLKQLRDQLVGKRWLIVLDDVWSEDRRTLLDLMNNLMVGLRGSWIMVTTRSEKTGTILGNEFVYRLKGLSKENSWLLFCLTAFDLHDVESALDFAPIGLDIVKRCAHVPLAIKVVGSLLYGQSKEKWISFQKKGLGRLKYGDSDGIEPILKLSYHQLDSPLKACFTYCALFPKDHVIEKDLLLNLWMAQDYVIPEEGQSVPEASDEYFSILVRRCFFQDITKDEYGEITSCKIHDLMHDMVQEIAGKEIHATNCFATSLDTEIRHLSYNSASEDVQGLLTHSKIRTCLRSELGPKCIPVDNLLTNWTCLRALDLSDSGIKSLPSSALGKLVHLRYLDLSFNLKLKMLSDSITKLHNLQTLILKGCLRLKELPKDLSKLMELRVLDIDTHCHDLNGMPQGIGKLACLQKLPLFVLVDDDSTLNQTMADKMEGLKALTKLKGSLEIKIINDTDYIAKNVGYIRNMELLSHVTFDLHRDWTEGVLLEDLQPHPKLKKLELVGYKGRTMPNWAIEDNLTVSLPNLVHLCLWSCRRLYHLPSLRKMRHLKSLRLCYLDDLEYIENTTGSSAVGNDVGSSESEMLLYPSLEKVELSNMPNLKGWWREDSTKQGQHTLASFPCLSKLEIAGCDSLTCIPPCPALEELELKGELNENLRMQITTESGHSKLRSVKTSNIGCLMSSLPMQTFQNLGFISLHGDDKVEALSEVVELLQICSSSLRWLGIKNCSNLIDLSLIRKQGDDEGKDAKDVEITCCSELKNLSLEEDGLSWRCLGHSLVYLRLENLPKVVKLPNEMSCLSTLRSLTICDCKGVEAVPEWIPQLTSLETFHILNCSQSLYKRCRNPTGEDWPKIQQINDFVTS